MKTNSTFLITLSVLSLFTTTHALVKDAPHQPAWVSQVVQMRVKDLVSQGKTYESRRDYSRAIEYYLEAVSLQPSDVNARELLLRVNEKDRQKTDKAAEKQRSKYARLALDTKRSQRAWRSAMDGKILEAERWKDKRKWARSYVIYLTLLEESPTYLPALKGLENLQNVVSRQLNKGGTFSVQEEKDVVNGFWLYAQNKWEDALALWTPLVENEALLRKWGRDVSLNEFAAKATRAQEVYVRQQQIDMLIIAGLEKFKNGQLEESQQEFLAVLAIDESNSQAKAYSKLIPGLREQLKQELRSEIQTKEINSQLSDALDFYLKGLYEEAEAKVDLVLTQDPQFPQALSLQNQIREARGLPKIPSIDEIKTAERLKLDSMFSDGVMAFAEGRTVDAKKLWADILQADPTHDKARRALQKVSSEETALKN